MKCLLPLYLALQLAPALHALNATLIDGVLTVPGSPPKTIGTTTSGITAAIATVFPPATGGDAEVILKNSSSFYNYLTLTGAYTSDAPLLLVAGLALVLEDATITATTSSLPGSGALIAALSAPWSAVVGRGVSRLVCNPSGGSQAPDGVYAAQSPGFVVDGITISDCGEGVHLEGKPYVTGGEVANCLLSNTRGRAIWTEKISRAVIHGNTIVNASSHTIDFDAFSSNSIAYNNTVSGSRQEAVFIEQGATYITVVDNDLGPGNANGVGVYNNAIGSVTSGHVIARNRIFGNKRGVSVGSTAPRSGAEDASVLVAGNTLWDNEGQGIHTNGGQVGTMYVGNSDEDGAALYTLQAGTAANISFADPSDRVKVADQ